MLVERDADEAEVGGKLQRARARGWDAVDQDWLKQCLLRQRVLPADGFPVRTRRKR